MVSSYALRHSPAFAPIHQVRDEWVRRAVGAMLVCYLMPLILTVFTIGAVGVALERGWRRPRSRG
jgi:hypothetical protein